MNVQSTQGIRFGQFKGAKGVTERKIPELVKLLNTMPGVYSARAGKSHVRVVDEKGLSVNLEGKAITDTEKMKKALSSRFPVPGIDA